LRSGDTGKGMLRIRINGKELGQHTVKSAQAP
jgi:hypothetical protein